MTARDVVLVVFPGLQGLDLIGPAEVFAAANQEVGRPAYRVRVVATTPGPAASSSGVDDRRRRGHRRRALGPIDTLMVVGGDGTYGAVADEHLVGHVARLAGGARRVTSVCSGAFVLAQAGLLDGRRATTHWRVCDLLARSFPAVQVDPDPIYVRDGNVWTSAGVTAGHGPGPRARRGRPRPRRRPRHRPALRAVPAPARQPEPVQRAAPGAGRRSTTASAPRSTTSPSTPTPTARSPRSPASRSMSERNFARCFTAEVGITPGALRRARPRRDGPPPARGHRRRRRGHRRGRRLRHRRDHAPHVPAPRAHQPHRVPPALPRRLTQGAQPTMDIAILLFDRLTALDAVGPYEVLSRLPDANLTFVATEAGPKRTDTEGAGARRRRHARRASRARTSSSCPAARGRRRPRRTRRSSTGCAPPTRPPRGRRRCAPARWCSAPPACSRASGPPPTGWPSTSWPATAPSPPTSGS